MLPCVHRKMSGKPKVLVKGEWASAFALQPTMDGNSKEFPKIESEGAGWAPFHSAQKSHTWSFHPRVARLTLRIVLRVPQGDTTN